MQKMGLTLPNPRLAKREKGEKRREESGHYLIQIQHLRASQIQMASIVEREDIERKSIKDTQRKKIGVGKDATGVFRGVVLAVVAQVQNIKKRHESVVDH